MALVFVLGYVFLRFAFLPEVLSTFFGFNTYSAPICGSLALLTSFLMGDNARFTRSKVSLLMVCFIGWIVVCTPMSISPENSFDVIRTYFPIDMIMFFMILSTTLSVNDIKRLMMVIAVAGSLDLLIAYKVGYMEAGRYILTFGSFRNPNDLATHLLVCVPFCAMLGMQAKKAFIKPVTLVVCLGFLYIVLRTGSRAGLLSLLIIFVCVVLRASFTQRIIFLAVGGFAAMIAISRMPNDTFLRYANMFGIQIQDEQLRGEVEGSTGARQQLFWDAVHISLEHPVFGVGPGNFPHADIDYAASQGRRSAGQVAHNSYTETSSETGFPGLVFFCSALFGSVFLASSALSKTRKVPELREASNMAFALLLSLLAFCVLIFFVSMSYRFYAQVLVAMAVSFYLNVKEEIKRLAEAKAKQPGASYDSTATGRAFPLRT